ncbi:phospholipase A and acyltransferase 4-like [Simochromis diagramma]|uniref:phospholipase A and acyltransferase 4-like n=1 Tax=Simochromis diagramma TaxID=43689 RepID=UPI001A7E593D|nr:phospholipase A and acyltransferase 4-like [Simochromis diagramma]
MRNFILVALTFHLLVIAVVEINGDYTFGDIISFQRKCAKINKAYKHFAVYVGTKNLFGQGEDKDIFHRIRKPEDGKYCVFGSLANQGEHKKENYLDKKLTPSSQADIIKHIEVMKAEENCGKYKLLNNNCEHLATWVRYGKAFVKQPGTKAGFFLKLSFGKKLPKAEKAMKSISDEEVIRILEELYKDSEVEDQC